MLSPSRHKYIVLKEKQYKFLIIIKIIKSCYTKNYTLIHFTLTFVAKREYIDERHGNITRGKLTAIDMTKPIFITSLDRHCEKLVRIFPENTTIQSNFEQNTRYKTIVLFMN